MNVCSYESQSPESNPEDCVREPDTGTITIVKDAVPDDAQDFTFDPSLASTGPAGKLRPRR